MIFKQTKNQGMATGFQFQVGNERLTMKQIVERAGGCSTSYATKCLRKANEDPKKFIARMLKKRFKKRGEYDK